MAYFMAVIAYYFVFQNDKLIVLDLHAYADTSGSNVGWALAHQIDSINADLQML